MVPQVTTTEEDRKRFLSLYLRGGEKMAWTKARERLGLWTWDILRLGTPLIDRRVPFEVIFWRAPSSGELFQLPFHCTPHTRIMRVTEESMKKQQNNFRSWKKKNIILYSWIKRWRGYGTRHLPPMCFLFVPPLKRSKCLCLITPRHTKHGRRVITH